MHERRAIYESRRITPILRDIHRISCGRSCKGDMRMTSIKLLIKGIIFLAIGIALIVANAGTMEIGIMLTILGVLSLGASIKKFLVPASVSGRSTSMGSSDHGEHEDRESVSQMITGHRRTIMPHDSQPQLPFEL